MGKPTARSERCRVVVKARPTAPRDEEALGDTLKVFENSQILLQRSTPFEADRVYLPEDGDIVYEDEVKGLVSSLFQGINATVFAYGASGSGKTYTVLGNPQQKGLVDRVTEDLFERFDPRTCKLSVMVEELYCETFTDLLASPDSLRRPGTAPTPSKPFSTPRQPGAGTKYKANELEVDSRAELDELLRKCLQKRRTANTLLNERSSRSHVVVTLTLTQHIPVAYNAGGKDTAGASGSSSAGGSGRSSPLSRSSSGLLSKHGDGTGTEEAGSDSSSEVQAPTSVTTYLIGKLYLVDLAGSENIKRSGAEGKQQKEAGEINKSLCHLKTVIEEIFRGNKVPTYRNSKLTFRLQDALGGGNSKLLVIACISTAKPNLAETKETLRFAEMARSIENKPVVNTQPKDALIKSLEYEIEMLKDQLQQASKGSTVPTEVYQQLSTLEAAYARIQEEKEVLERKVAAQQATASSVEASLRQQLDQACSEFAAFKSTVAAFEQRLQQQLVAAEAKAAAQLAAAKANAYALQQQLDAQRTAATHQQQEVSKHIMELQRQLGTEQAEVQQQKDVVQQLGAAVEEMTAALQTANAQLDGRDEQNALLQGELAAQQAATGAARDACSDQEQLAQQLQQQLTQQAAEMQDLQQQLHHQRQEAAQLQQLPQQERQAKADALGALASTQASLQQVAMQCDILQGQLKAQRVMQSLASSLCNNCTDSAAGLQQQLLAESNNAELLKASLLQQEQQSNAQRAAAAQQAQQVAAQHQQARQQWQQQLQAAESSIAQLQQQSEGAAATHAAEVFQLRQQAEAQVNAHRAVVSELQQQAQAASAAHAATVAELHQQAEAAAERHAATVAGMKQQAANQAAAHAAELAAMRQQAAAAAAAHSAEVAELQQQAAAAAEAHAVEVASLKQQHQQELDRIQQQSMQKANTEKLRCKEHLALQVHNLMADAQSLSEALAADLVVQVPAETPIATPSGSPHGLAGSSTASGGLAAPGAEGGAQPTEALQQQQQQQTMAVGSAEDGSSSSSEHDASETEQQDSEDSDAAGSNSSSFSAAGSELGGGAASRSDRSETAEGTEGMGDHAQDLETETAIIGDEDLETASSSSSSSSDAASDSDCESSCSLADTYLRQHQHHNMQHQQQPEHQQHEQQGMLLVRHNPTVAMSPMPAGTGAGMLGSPLPAISPAIANPAAAAGFKAATSAVAAAAAESGAAAAEWPKQYKPKEAVDESVAASVFYKLTGESLTVKALKKFLREKELGGQRHSSSMRLGEGSYTQEKRKHELMQDFMAWYTHQAAAAAAAAAGGGSNSTLAALSGTSSPAPMVTPGPRWEDMSSSPAAATVTTKAAAAVAEEPWSPVVGCTSSQPQWRGSSSGGVEVVDLYTPDTSKAAAVMAAAAQSPIELSPTSSGSSIWGWFSTPRSARKTKTRTAAAAAGQIKQEHAATAARTQSYNTQKRPVSTAGGGDDGRIPSKQQQQHGPLAVAATGPAAVAEGVVTSPRSSSCATTAAGSAAGSSMLDLFLQNHLTPDPKASAGARRGPLIAMDKLLAAQRAKHSRDKKAGGRGQSGASVAGLERRAREVRISSRRS